MGLWAYADVVVCEPQDGANPTHPATYWYDVTPEPSGRCDFHVRVFDPHPDNYTNPTLPTPNWQFGVHQVGNESWASWWDPGCMNAIFSTFRFQFENPNPSTWGDWSTTISATSDPNADVVNRSALHEGEPNGYGYRVHVPIVESEGAVEHVKWSQPPIEIDPTLRCVCYCGWDELSHRYWVEPFWYEAWNCRTQCRGDADCNRYVGQEDLDIYNSPGGYDPRADFTRDGSITIADLFVLKANFETYPPADCALRAESSKVVADDFRCLGTMPITSVRWWGSYLGWEQLQPPAPEPITWRIGFWSNVPPDPDGEPDFSYPGELLWQVAVPADRVQAGAAGVDVHPSFANEDTCFEYYVQLEPQEYFWQSKFETQDEVFWLSITALYPVGANIVYPWGWKTRPWSWMDDAVSFEIHEHPEPGMATNPVQVTEIRDPCSGESVDMAFELDTDPNYIKCEQPFTGIRHWPHYWDELSMATRQMPLEFEVSALVADDWPCQSRRPVTAIAWWGSYIGYHYAPCQNRPTIRPRKPDYFQLSIWDDWQGEPDGLVWTYDACDFDEVLVGYDKQPEDQIAAPREPVFRYSVKLPREAWFFQNDMDTTYWLSVLAVFDGVSVPTECEVVDDMEAYDLTTNRIEQTWVPGQVYVVPLNGSDVRLGIAPNDPVHDGNQSMVCYYDNRIDWGYGYYSELEGRIDYQDWITGGAQLLVLWFYGDRHNDANETEQMYVGVEDAFGQYAQVRYGGHGEDMNDIRKEQWQAWCIELADFNNTGVNLESVILMFIGFGARNSLVPGGEGVVFFDDITLCNGCPDEPAFPWGWTNHTQVFGAGAVSGSLIADPFGPTFLWSRLHDQTGASEDMSFALFSEPDPTGGTCVDPHECAGHSCCDITCDGSINLSDLFALKASFGKSAPWGWPECCADCNGDLFVNLGDLFRLKECFGRSGYVPSTGNQTCPQ
jgi:hypothetical protein